MEVMAMKRFSLNVCVVALNLAFGMGAVTAEAQTLERKKSFLETLFQSKKSGKKIVQAKKKILFKKKGKRRPSSTAGGKTMTPASRSFPRAMAVRSSAFQTVVGMTMSPKASAWVTSPMCRKSLWLWVARFLPAVRPFLSADAAIFDALADANLGIKVLPTEKTAILAAYHSAGFRPMWIDAGRPSERARAVLKILAAASEEGLTPARYLPPVLPSFAAIDALDTADPAGLGPSRPWPDGRRPDLRPPCQCRPVRPAETFALQRYQARSRESRRRRQGDLLVAVH